MAKKPVNYIDNAAFLLALKEHRKARSAASATKTELPRLPEYIGECFLKIATNLSHKPNFMNYTFRDDMVSDGVTNCLEYCNNFDPDKSSNPFGYFTQIIYYAFVRRIQREKKHTYIKYKMIEKDLLSGDSFQEQASSPKNGTDGGTSGRAMLAYDNVQDFINRFDTYTNNRRARRKLAKGRDVEVDELVEVE